MIPTEMLAEMRRLVLREGFRIETVARKFGVHHSVVRRALREAAASSPSVPTSGLDPHKPYIVQRLQERPELTAARLVLELRDRGCALGPATVRRFVAKVREPRARKAYLRVEVDPGEQAQVDWGLFGHMRVGATRRPLCAFAMVLSWSRMLFVDFAFDMRMETFWRMHSRALEYFGGVPRRILYDNLKSVVLHHVGKTVQFNPRFLTFAGHYLFEPVAAPVRYPEAKGKVEGAIKYLRHSFFYGRSFSSMEDLRAQAAQWRDQIANVRIHGTTRERPADRLRLERTRLHALPGRPFDSDFVEPTIVSKEARVRFDANTYSVPPQYVGQTVHLRIDDVTVCVVANGQQIASHPRCFDRHRHIEDREHVEKLLERRPGAHPTKRKDRIASMSDACRVYLQEIARRRIHLENEVRRLLRLIEIYGEDEFMEGVAKALAARTFGANFVRTFIDQSRFARGLPEPPDPIVTGNRAADDLVIKPHDLENYDALFENKDSGRRAGGDPDPHQ